MTLIEEERVILIYTRLIDTLSALLQDDHFDDLNWWSYLVVRLGGSNGLTHWIRLDHPQHTHPVLFAVCYRRPVLVQQPSTIHFLYKIISESNDTSWHFDRPIHTHMRHTARISLRNPLKSNLTRFSGAEHTHLLCDTQWFQVPRTFSNS